MPLKTGRVLLVGAGPGAADLLTVRALRAVQAADAILYDALVDDEVLAMAPAACLRMQTGKRAGKASMPQAAINRLMLRLALRGLVVVRLKSGDPSVFGRSGEEVDVLEGHGVPVEIVPGVTAASAAAAQFGFPLTHRGEARRLVFATARLQDGVMVEEGWVGLADPEATLALYMARDCAAAVSRRLIAAGRSPRTPALAVENAGRREARLLETVLGNLGPAVEDARFEGPVVLLIGEVARRARGEDPGVIGRLPARAAG
jgi:uroporphyrin-III C-methyltransferase